MRMRNLLVWVAVGLIGLALAAGVTYAATQLSSQRIGLSAEPPSAGEELAPPHGARLPRVVVPPSQTTTAPAPATGDDERRGDRGSSRDEGRREPGGRSDWDD